MPLAKPVPNTGPVCDPATCEVPGCGHDGRDPRDHGTRMCDALYQLCRDAQTLDLPPESHGAPARVSITISYEDLQRGAGFAETETGETLSGATLRRICCDAEIIPIVLGLTQRGPRRRPPTTPGHTSDLESTRRPRQALPLPELHPTTLDDPRPPHHPLG